MSASDVHNVAVVTGAARGLGAAIVRALLAQGFKVLATDADEARLQDLKSDLTLPQDSLACSRLDVREVDDFKNAIDKAIELWGGAGVLVSNAAITRTTPLFEITPEEFDQVMQINLRGVFLGCQTFGRYFRDQGYGRIVNMASLAAQNGGAATGAHYAASKGGIVTLTKVFARDLAAHGVTVNAVSPGPLDVELVREILPADKLEAVIGAIPVGRLGDPAFIADMVCLLASPTASSVTGATFDANGGLYVR